MEPRYKHYKIIFLDIDGVLNLMRQDRDQYGTLFHDNFVANLKRIIDETNAWIVISSTWRMSGLESIIEMWEDRKLPGNVVGITPNLKYHPDNIDDELVRGDEIQSWIDKYEITDYVIIDDDTDMLPHQMSRFVKTSDNIDHTDYLDIGYGLTIECAEQAIKILNNK